MKDRTFEAIEMCAWVAGIVALAAGCVIQWGGGAALIAVGALFTIWPLAKTFQRRSR